MALVKKPNLEEARLDVGGTRRKGGRQQNKSFCGFGLKLHSTN